MNINRKRPIIDDFENDKVSRRSFTPGWTEAIENDDYHSLPIKTLDGKVVQVKRSQAKSKLKTIDDDKENNIEDIKIDSKSDVDTRYETSNGRNPNSNIVVYERAMKVIREYPTHEVRSIISTICTNISADPEASLLKKKSINSMNTTTDEITEYGIKELFEFLKQNENTEISEVAMLSILLVFKDIIPNYRIRQTSNTNAHQSDTLSENVKLKKETKRLMDYETNLLQLYQHYLNILESKVASGLGSVKKPFDNNHNDSRVSLGLSALRCQCQLLRSVSHFNYRSQLLTSVVTRCIQPNEEIVTLCSSTLSNIFQNDNDGDISYEIVRLMSSTLTTYHYEVPEKFIECLSHVKVYVHADKADALRKLVKKGKRKRKRSPDEVEKELMEADALKDKSLVQKNQVNCLKEICMIYFR